MTNQQPSDAIPREIWLKAGCPEPGNPVHEALLEAMRQHDDLFRQLCEAVEALVECFIKRGPFDEPLGESEQAPSINAGVKALAAAQQAGVSKP